MRLRKDWTREHLLGEANAHTPLDISIQRLEDHIYKPKPKTLQALFAALDIDQRVFLPYLDAESTTLYAKADEIRRLLEQDSTPEFVKHAEEQMAVLETHEGFKEGHNRQLLLSLKVQLYIRLEKPSQEILPLIREAMRITYTNFDENDFDSSLMYLEEPELLHSLALVYAKDGALAPAVALLESIIWGLANTPIDANTKEKKVTPIQLSLALLLMQTGDYRQAAVTCVDGYHTSCRYDHGKYVPDFLLNLALCLLKLEDTTHCRSLLQCAYFGYALLHKKEQANHVLTTAKDMFGITFETYGVETLDLLPEPPKPKAYGKPIVCDSIGEFIRQLRVEAKMTQGELCSGICSVNNLSKIEKNTITTNIYIMEALMQRLGRHMDLYITLFPSLEDFKEKEIRDEINTLIDLWQFDDAEALLNPPPPMWG